MKKIIYYIGLFFLAIWLFTIHSKFAFALDPLQNNDNDFYAKLFILLGYDFKMVLPYVWGSTFAIATTVIVALLKKQENYFWFFAFTISSLELLGVFLFNYPEHGYLWMKVASFYYGIYAGIMVFLYIYISYEKEEILNFATNAKTRIAKNNSAKVAKEMKDKIVSDLQNDIKPKDICKKYKLKPYQVTRIKQKMQHDS